MRFIEFKDGEVILASRRASSHKEMLSIAGRSREQVASAGFLSSRYSAAEPWEPYGRSDGLGIAASNPELRIPMTLFVGKTRYCLVYASSRDMLRGLQDVEVAQWGMTEESPWGDVMPVFAPLHPKHSLKADAAICD